MMTSSAAQSSTLRFKQQTWLCLGVILVAHVVGYAILSTQIQKRFEWVQEPGGVEENGEGGQDKLGHTLWCNAVDLALRCLLALAAIGGPAARLACR
jgi:hypothetical protein